jgi:hypothetical protein
MPVQNRLKSNFSVPPFRGYTRTVVFHFLADKWRSDEIEDKLSTSLPNGQFVLRSSEVLGPTYLCF